MAAASTSSLYRLTIEKTRVAIVVRYICSSASGELVGPATIRLTATIWGRATSSRTTKVCTSTAVTAAEATVQAANRTTSRTPRGARTSAPASATTPIVIADEVHLASTMHTITGPSP